MDSNNGFTIFYKYVRKAQVYNSFTNMFARRVFTICSQSVGFTTIFTLFTQMLCPLFLFFLFTIYTQGNWVAGSSLFLSLQFFFFCLNSICQQRELPLFLVACGREILFILFWRGKGDWGYLYFLSPLRGF